MAPEWITKREAAARLGISLRTVDRWMASGYLDAKRVGPKWIRISVASVDRVLTGGDTRGSL